MEQESKVSITELHEDTCIMMTLKNDAGSTRSMEFHPVQQTLLLGTNTGDIALWDLSSKKMLAGRSFCIWNLQTMANESSITVNRVTWSPDGNYFGVAYSQHLVHLYKYSSVGNYFQDFLEIDAHVGSVNDLAFSATPEGLLFVTCGTDRGIKVWKTSNGLVNILNIEHGYPVFSVSLFQQDGLQYTISTLYGKETVWLYDGQWARRVREAPRLLDTKQTENLADDTSTCIQFDMGKLFFAVMSETGGIYILATQMGMRMLAAFNTKRSSAVYLEAGLGDVEYQPSDGSTENLKSMRLYESIEHSQFHAMRLTDALLTRNRKVSRITYSHSEESLLALASNGVHSLWKLQKRDQCMTGKASTFKDPQLFRPPSGDVMINELNYRDNGNSVSCFALSIDDAYLVSLSGGSVGVFNMVTFENMARLSSSSHPTCIAFHPRNTNVIAMGMEDSFIHIYNYHLDKVQAKFQGHEKEVTGLAFSTVLNVLVIIRS